MDNNGRPETTQETYESWLEEMKPFLKAGNTIGYACEKANLWQHKTTIYEKYRLNDWFSEKINRWRALPGELVNEFFYKEVMRIIEKQKQSIPLTREEVDTMKHFSEKHRSAQPFFVNRYEMAQADPDEVGKTLDVLDKPKTDYGKLGQSVKGQGVAINPPIQNSN